jgi:hypothetical protein
MRRWWIDILIIILFAILTVFIFRNYVVNQKIPFPANLLISIYEPWISYPQSGYPNGAPNKPMGFDNLRIYYPIKKLAIDLIKNKELPLWNPYAFSGNTLLGTYQSAIFHPLAWLFLILPQIDAWSIIILLQPFFGLVFMYFFLKEIGFDRISSLFGACTFGLAPFAVVWWEETYMAWYSAMVLPLILLGMERLSKKYTFLNLFITIVGIVWTIVSGAPQMTFYVFVFTGGWMTASLILKRWNIRVLIPISISIVVALLITGVHIIPAFEAYSNSARSSTDAKYIFTGYLVPIKHLITLIAPDFWGSPATYTYFGEGFYYERMAYFGIVPLILVLITAGVMRYKEKRSWLFYTFLAILSLGFSLPTSWFILYYLKIPFVSVVTPSRIFFLSMFVGSILSAYGLRLVIQGLSKKLLIEITLIFSSILGWIWISLFEKQREFKDVSSTLINMKNMIIPSLFILIVILILWISLKKSINKTCAIIILICSIVSSLYFCNKYLYFSDRKFVFPQNPVITELQKVKGVNRFWSFGKGYIFRNFPTYYSLFSPEGYDSFYIRNYGELIYAAKNQGKYTREVDRADALIESTDRINELLINPYRKRLLDILGVKYIVVKKIDLINKQLPPELKKVWSDDKYAIFEYSLALPRVFLVGDYDVYSSGPKLLEALYDKSFQPDKKILLEIKLDNFEPSKITGYANIVSYTANKINIVTENPQNALLYLSDNYYPGWKAYIDGKETEIYRANYTFRTVVSPSGKHLVEFVYEPQSWKIGLTLTIMGLCILIGIFSFNKRIISRNKLNI